MRRAAVCIAVCGVEDPEILLIERSSTLRSHAGQWGLPGGRLDPGETSEIAAVRELREELGIEAQPAEVVGLLDDYATRSGYVITPVLIRLRREVHVVPNPDEVASAFSIKLSELRQDDRFIRFRLPEMDADSVKMHLLGDFLHAPTAAILYQFCRLEAGELERVAHLEQPFFAWR